jgi:conjugal transfer pilus assembly protein TraF
MTVIATVQAATALAQDDTGNSFYDDREQGWYFYERDAEPEKKEKPEPKEPEPKKADKKDKPDEPAERAPVSPPSQNEKKADEPKPFSSAWLNQNMEKFKRRAIDNPTRDNVAAYMMLQRLAMDKASRFAQKTRQVRMEYPRLDATNRRPGASYAKDAVDARSNRKAKKLTSEILAQTGLWFFYQGRDCPTCKKQATVLQSLQQQHGDVTLWPITLDGYPMRNDSGRPVFNQRRVDEGQAKRLGVSKGPAIYLVVPEGGVQRITHGPLALPKIERRIRLAALDAGLISQQQFQKSRHVDPSLDIVGPGRSAPRLPGQAEGQDGQLSSRAIIEALSSRRADRR